MVCIRWCLVEKNFIDENEISLETKDLILHIV